MAQTLYRGPAIGGAYDGNIHAREAGLRDYRVRDYRAVEVEQ